MTGARDESGFTLIELLVTMVLMVVVLGATLMVLEGMHRTSDRSERQNAAREQARAGIEALSRGLRDDAKPTPELPAAIEKATGNDLVVIGTGSRGAGSANARAAERVRYCVDTGARVLRRQVQTWTTAAPPASPSTASCAAGGWTSSFVIATDVANDAARPLFTYSPTPAGTTPPQTAAIASIDARLRIDADPATRPAETQLETRVDLRNANQGPSASFDARPDGTRVVQLLGATSTDPESLRLRYRWRDETAGADLPACDDRSTCEVTAPVTGSRTYRLTVTDSGDLTATTTKAVTVT